MKSSKPMWHTRKAANTAPSDYECKSSGLSVWWFGCWGMYQSGRDASGRRKQTASSCWELGNKCLLRFCKIWWLPWGGKGFIEPLGFIRKAREKTSHAESKDGFWERAEIRAEGISVLPAPLHSPAPKENEPDCLLTHPTGSPAQRNTFCCLQRQKFWERMKISESWTPLELWIVSLKIIFKNLKFIVTVLSCA